MKTILVAVDFSSATEPVLGAAEMIAGRAKARMVVVHASQAYVALAAYSYAGTQAELAQEAEIASRLERLRKGYEADGFEAESRLLFGDPGLVITDEARKCGAEYIVLGSSGHGLLRRALLGSTTHYVLRHASCPVLVVPVGAESRPRAEETAAMRQDRR
jgi:nucleotide-binding universal stress UspA family protein